MSPDMTSLALADIEAAVRDAVAASGQVPAGVQGCRVRFDGDAEAWVVEIEADPSVGDLADAIRRHLPDDLPLPVEVVVLDRSVAAVRGDACHITGREKGGDTMSPVTRGALFFATACVVVGLVWFVAWLRRTATPLAGPTVPDDEAQEQILQLVAAALYLHRRNLPTRLMTGDGQYTVSVQDSHEGLHAVVVWKTTAIRPTWVLAANVWESGDVGQRVLSLRTGTETAVKDAVKAISWTPDVDYIVQFDPASGGWEATVRTRNPRDGLAGEIEARLRSLPVRVRVLVRVWR